MFTRDQYKWTEPIRTVSQEYEILLTSVKCERMGMEGKWNENRKMGRAHEKELNVETR